jgi:hypothetical protein
MKQQSKCRTVQACLDSAGRRHGDTSVTDCQHRKHERVAQGMAVALTLSNLLCLRASRQGAGGWVVVQGVVLGFQPGIATVKAPNKCSATDGVVPKTADVLQKQMKTSKKGVQERRRRQQQQSENSRQAPTKLIPNPC